MNSETTDAIAQQAARLLADGRATTVRSAVKTATASLAIRDASLPSEQLVRDHLRAISMESLGADGYKQRVRETIQIGEQIMTLLETSWPECRTLLVGRAATGNVDGGVTLHIRLHCDRSVTELACLLVDGGYDEPSFTTAETKAGRFSRVVVDVEDQVVTLTRIPRSVQVAENRDVFTGKPIKVATLDDVRQLLNDLEGRQLSDPV